MFFSKLNMFLYSLKLVIKSFQHSLEEEKKISFSALAPDMSFLPGGSEILASRSWSSTMWHHKVLPILQCISKVWKIFLIWTQYKDQSILRLLPQSISACLSVSYFQFNAGWRKSIHSREDAYYAWRMREPCCLREGCSKHLPLLRD